MKPLPLGFAPLLSADLIGVNSSFAFLSGLGRPQETPTLCFLSVPLQPCIAPVTILGKNAGPASSETGAIPGCFLPSLPRRLLATLIHRRAGDGRRGLL